MIEQSACRGEAEDPCAEVGEVLWTGKNVSSYEGNGNSAILSIRGALTETSGDFKLWRMPTLGRQAGFCLVAFVAIGRDALRLVITDLLVWVEAAGNWGKRDKERNLCQLKLLKK